MKAWHNLSKTWKKNDESGVRNFAFKTLAVVVAISSVIAFAHSTVTAAETADSYCKKFTVSAQKTACHDGWQGKDCTEYEQFAPENREICEKARDAGNAAKDEPSTDKGDDATGSEGDSGSGDKEGDKESDKEKEGDKGDGKINPDTIPDNNYGQYVNGAGKLQQLRVNRAPGDSRPAIVFINGGGWHADDGVGDKIAPHANERGYTTIVATYRLGSSGIYYMLDDVMRALRHVRNNAGMYGIDPNRIAVWGDSAGGSLALRAAGTGLSGAKVAVGWSAPTNAYTALFASARSFAIGMDHSTCVPTDLNGISDVVDQLNGGEGTDPLTRNDGGLGNNSVQGINGSNLITSVLEVATQAQKTGKSAEAISKKLETDEGVKELGENARRLASKKFIECIDNFNSGSPALFASGLSPPALLAGYDSDPLVHPDQAYQMRDKLRALGIPSEALILPGVKGDALSGAIGTEVPGENHLDYNEKFVKPSLDFVDKFLHPES